MGKTWVLHNSAQKTSAALCVYDISAVFRQLTRIHRNTWLASAVKSSVALCACEISVVVDS